MKLKIFQVDAFADRLFAGNPAAVCPLEEFLPDETMQSIATENNLSETAFFVAKNGRFHIRWFTPAREVKLCGHATLATAYVIFNFLKPEINRITFDSLSGPLHVNKLQNQHIQLDFPAIKVEETNAIADISNALGISPKAVYQSIQDYLVILDNQQQVTSVQPDISKLKNLDLRGVIISSESDDEYDFVSRYFAPKVDVPEDPVTGSAHCILTPYRADTLNKKSLLAKQMSKRGGVIRCDLQNDRVLLSGLAVLYLKGEIAI